MVEKFRCFKGFIWFKYVDDLLGVYFNKRNI